MHFRANREAPVYAELLGIVTKTFGVADVLRRMLVPFKSRVRLAFIYGSIAKGSANAASDVDLLLVADLHPPRLAQLDRVRKQLGRNISVVTYGSEERLDACRSTISSAPFSKARRSGWGKRKILTNSGMVPRAAGSSRLSRGQRDRHPA
jgi:predicted nucleotidyltransferase